VIRVLRGIVRVVFVLVLVGALGIAGVAAVTLARFGRDLPDYQQLAAYVPATGTKIYAGDGALMAEFESEHRIIVPIAKVPRLVIQAFLAAEDHDFYNHRGVSPLAIFRAAIADIARFGRGQRPIGASTITQQVVRHFLLSNEVSVSRKVKEAILAYRIEGALSKERILEIYLNEIYLGSGAYGVAAAADTYFQKPLDQLNLAEAAFLGALPKAPNNYNPIRHPATAKARRDWVLASMADLGWVAAAQAKAAMGEPLVVHPRGEPATDPAAGQNGYFAEEVRRELVARFGEKPVYEGGLSVHTSYVPVYQQMAETAFRKGLVEYDRRHGWRGPLAHLASGMAAQGALPGMADPPGVGSWRLAAVTAIDAGGATVALKGGGIGRIPLDELRWARHTIEDQRLGAAVRQARDVLDLGDIVLVEPVTAAPPPKGKQAAVYAVPTYGLRQMPDVSGGVVVMDPKTGRVFALVGGWSFQQSQFNRATQAKRQPGSAFKPLVYVTALQNGFTPSSVVDDTPIDIPQGPGQAPWQPVNYEGGYIGPTTLEDALIHSRNLATVHVAMTIGMPAIAKTVQDLGVMDHMPLYYSMALGAGETTLLRLTTAYAMLDNGGHWLTSSVVDLVQDRNGRILYQKGVSGCAACFVAGGPGTGPDTGTLYRAAGAADPSTIWLPKATYADHALVYKPTKRDPLIAADADADILSMMQGVVERGTGIAVAAVGKPLAGKTGTTSDWYDAWFVGFSPEIAAGVFVGFDDPRTLGDGEVGGHVAAPIFRDFMMAALKDKPATPFPPAARPVVANAARSATGDANGDPAQLNRDLASLNGDVPIADETAPGERAYDTGGRGWQPAPTARGYPMPTTPDYAAPQWSGYAPPRMPDYPPASGQGYAPTWSPAYAPPAWGQAYAAPAAPIYPAAPPPGYAVPPAPSYPAPGGAGRPGRGTGGLY
jgi:penicillin-binding protein 1A